MSDIDVNLIMHWLDDACVAHYVCGDCHGLHLNEPQELLGVVESRLFVEEDALLYFTELEIRPASLMTVLSEVARFNLTYMHLKIFVDLVDDSLPRLVVQDTFPFSAGMDFSQFHLFIENCIQATLHLTEECQNLNYLTTGEGESVTATSSMH